MKFLILKDNPEFYDIVLNEFYNEWFEYYNDNEIYNVDDLKLLFQNKKLSKTFILINKNNKFIGSFTLSKNGNKLFFENFFVIPLMRNRNIGKYMMDYCFNIINEDLYVYCNEEMLGFYLNRGFIKKDKVLLNNKSNKELYLLKYKISKTSRLYYYFLYILIFLSLLILIKIID